MKYPTPDQRIALVCGRPLITLLDLWEMMKSIKVDSIATFFLELYGNIDLLSSADETTRHIVMQRVKNVLGVCENLCAVLDLSTSLLKVQKLIGSSLLDDGIGVIFVGSDMLKTRVRDVADTMIIEMQRRLYMEIPPEQAAYYTDPEPFGTNTHARFPSISYDASEAYKCIALDRSTACVLHLMRVLEVGLCALAQQLGVSHQRANWQNIIDGMEKCIRGMAADPDRPSDWRERQERYSQVAMHFIFIKNAWRNHAAHGNEKYTVEEAKVILENTKAFMQALSREVSDSDQVYDGDSEER